MVGYDRPIRGFGRLLARRTDAARGRAAD